MNKPSMKDRVAQLFHGKGQLVLIRAADLAEMIDDAGLAPAEQDQWFEKIKERTVMPVEAFEAKIERHPPDGRYNDKQCLCYSSCPMDCDGACGCEACLDRAGDRNESTA